MAGTSRKARPGRKYNSKWKAAPPLQKQTAASRERKIMKTITAFTWDESRNYTQVEVPWPEEGDERKPSPKPLNLGIPELELVEPATEPVLTETEPVDLAA
jgi:hypothetical protein